LSTEEGQKRLEIFGPNKLEERKAKKKKNDNLIFYLFIYFAVNIEAVRRN
jgi:H+-transporting ATPase